MGGSSERSVRRGRKKARFTPRGGRVNLGVARATFAGDGIVAAVARSKNWAEDVTQFRPSMWVAHGSGVRVPCECPEGVMLASCLELAVVRNECGEVVTLVHAWWQAASDVKSIGWRQGGLFCGCSHSSLSARHPKLPQGSIEKGISASCVWFRLAVIPCLRP